MKFNPIISVMLLLMSTSLLLFSCSKTNTPSTIPPAPRGDVFYDVVYGSNTDWLGQEQALTMDIYMPANMAEGKKYPMVLSLHPGAYKAGRKENQILKCQILADSGFIAVAINYRIGWDNGDGLCTGDTLSLYKAGYRGMQDANASMRFLVSKAAEYRIDTSWMFYSGNSAGASVALNCYYINDDVAKSYNSKVYAELGGVNNATNSLTDNFSVKGICSIAGALPDSNMIHEGKTVPTIFFQGAEDETIPVDAGRYLMCPNYNELFGTLCLYRRLVTNNTVAIAHILPGSGHENTATSGYNDEFTMSNTACFFHSIMQGKTLTSKIYQGMEESCR